jgi:hypothetical protein
MVARDHTQEIDRLSWWYWFFTIATPGRRAECGVPT